MYRILVPVDKNADRAIHQVEYVTSFPETVDGVAVKIIHVDEVDYPGGPQRTITDFPAPITVRDRLREAGINCEAELHRGQVSKTILEVIEEYDPDQIVMAGRDRSGVMKTLLGSVTHDVVLATERPVVVVG